MADKRVVIVVPIYRVEKTIFENVSWKQLVVVLGCHEICLVAPMSLSSRKISEAFGNYRQEKFNDVFFEGTRGYSSLCLSVEFYQRFIEYEYILIYQLDAFVFSDRLMEFVSLGYDYIGAPLFDRNPDSNYWRDYHVGNGGFSLRRIDNAIRLLNQKYEILESLPDKEYYLEREDNFFAYCGWKKDIDFSVPSPDIAGLFSAQDDCFGVIRLINSRGLPFGMHHFPTWNYQYWRPIITKIGYALPDIDEVDYIDTLEEQRRDRYHDFFLNKICSFGRSTISDICIKMGFDLQGEYCVWGNGKWGAYVIRVLTELGLSIDCIFDSNRSGEKNVVFPSEDVLKEKKNLHHVVIVSSEKYDDEICSVLKKSSFINKKDFLSFSDFYRRWVGVEDEYINIFEKIEGITTPIMYLGN